MLSLSVSSLSFNGPALLPRVAPAAAAVRMGVADMCVRKKALCQPCDWGAPPGLAL